MKTIKYPDPKCPDGKSHYFKQVWPEIWQCEKCKQAKWLPNDLKTAMDFGLEIKHKGLQVAYDHALAHNPQKRLILTEMKK